MSVTVFSGGAGCGKTHQLMQRLSEVIADAPPGEGQKVLALTFMHGARRRLDERLGIVPGLARRYECTTLDSFASRIVRRWQSLAVQLGARVPSETEYEETCTVAALILEQPEVVRWVKASFPILVLDEAQDLSETRLQIIQCLATELTTLIAADEFQCLNETLRPNPAWAWLNAQRNRVALDKPMRTRVTALLDAAAAVRAGGPAVAGKGFSICHTATPPMAGGFLNTRIAGLNGGGLAIITPSVKNFAEGVISWSSSKSNSRGLGPYPIEWEKSETRDADAALERIALPPEATPAQALAAIQATHDQLLVRELTSWLDRLTRTRNTSVITREVLAERIVMICANRRRYQRSQERGLRAMSVHGAKNREFENVVVLWPAAVAGDDEHKRRLLYNAITRAKSACLVLVQLKKQLDQPPFK